MYDKVTAKVFDTDGVGYYGDRQRWFDAVDKRLKDKCENAAHVLRHPKIYQCNTLEPHPPSTETCILRKKGHVPKGYKLMTLEDVKRAPDECKPIIRELSENENTNFVAIQDAKYGWYETGLLYRFQDGNYLSHDEIHHMLLMSGEQTELVNLYHGSCKGKRSPKCGNIIDAKSLCGQKETKPD